MSTRALYLKPIRYRVTLSRSYAGHAVAQEAGTINHAFLRVWQKFAKKYLPTAGHKRKAVLAFRATKLLLGDRAKPIDRVYYAQTNCHLCGVTVKIEVM